MVRFRDYLSYIYIYTHMYTDIHVYIYIYIKGLCQAYLRAR